MNLEKEISGLYLGSFILGSINLIWAAKYALHGENLLIDLGVAFVALTLTQAIVLGFGYAGYQVVEYIWDKQNQGYGEPSKTAWAIGILFWLTCAGASLYLLEKMPAFKTALDTISTMKEDHYED